MGSPQHLSMPEDSSLIGAHGRMYMSADVDSMIICDDHSQLHHSPKLDALALSTAIPA